MLNGVKVKKPETTKEDTGPTEKKERHIAPCAHPTQNSLQTPAVVITIIT